MICWQILFVTKKGKPMLSANNNYLPMCSACFSMTRSIVVTGSMISELPSITSASLLTSNIHSCYNTQSSHHCMVTECIISTFSYKTQMRSAPCHLTSFPAAAKAYYHPVNHYYHYQVIRTQTMQVQQTKKLYTSLELTY